MTVAELIEKLQEMPQDYTVKIMVWKYILPILPNEVGSDDRNKVIIIYGNVEEEDNEEENDE